MTFKHISSEQILLEHISRHSLSHSSSSFCSLLLLPHCFSRAEPRAQWCRRMGLTMLRVPRGSRMQRRTLGTRFLAHILESTSRVTLYSKYSRALMFQNVCQGRRQHSFVAMGHTFLMSSPANDGHAGGGGGAAAQPLRRLTARGQRAALGGRDDAATIPDVSVVLADSLCFGGQGGERESEEREFRGGRQRESTACCSTGP